jgi:flavin reductase (DIM6/NTAB) family NADH-FMN oxidoreductase RutF
MHRMTEKPCEGTIDAGSFWKALGARSVGVAVVASRDASGPAGLLALSVTHLCASPPILMVAIGNTTSALPVIVGSSRFSINYLANTDKDLADVFSGKGPLKGAARFDPKRWSTLVTGAPTLVGAIGVLDCVVEETVERYGTMIVLGRLVGFSPVSGDRPLISFAGTIQ